MIHVTVVLAWPQEAWQTQCVVPEGACVADALACVPWRQEAAKAGVLLEEAMIGIWGVVKEHNTQLADGDRIEIYRPIQRNPQKERVAKVAAQVALEKKKT